MPVKAEPITADEIKQWRAKRLKNARHKLWAVPFVVVVCLVVCPFFLAGFICRAVAFAGVCLLDCAGNDTTWWASYSRRMQSEINDLRLR